MKPHITLAHQYWRSHLKEGDLAIDATCGNGHDTLVLAELVGKKGRVIALDIQDQALENSRRIVKEKFYFNVSFFQQSHATFPNNESPASLIVYNLGYLPGGDKSITTQTDTTLESLRAALTLLASRGMISITFYPGHPEGLREEEAISTWLESLPSPNYSVCHHRWLNRKLAPSLIIIQNNY